jgi:hypothetical protein
MSKARHNKPHPTGERHKMTPAWKDRVRAALDQRGESEQWLADEVAKRRGMKEMKRDTINKLLRRQQVSVLVPDICAILGVPPPMIEAPIDEETQRDIALIIAAPDDVRRAVRLLLSGRSRSD